MPGLQCCERAPRCGTGAFSSLGVQAAPAVKHGLWSVWAHSQHTGFSLVLFEQNLELKKQPLIFALYFFLLIFCLTLFSTSLMCKD